MTLLRRPKRTLWIIVFLIFIGAIMSNYWQHENASSVESGLQRNLLNKINLTSDSRTSGKDERDDARSKPQRDSIDNILSAITKRRFPKVYIYNLPAKYNLDIQQCVSPINYGCLRLKNRGFGESLYKDGELRVFRTHQFSLEVIIHNLLLLSKYRTKDPTEADIFYIPAYMGIQFFCKSDVNVKVLQEGMFSFVNSMPYLKQGRPHLSAAAKIEREMAHESFPVLKNPLCRNVTYIVIEKESNEKNRKFIGLEKQRVIVAPYPSYGHLDSMLSASQTLPSPSLESRRVFMFLAASDRRTNSFRNSIVDQFTHSVTDTRVSDYIAIFNISSPGLHQVWLNTRECKSSHENITIEWMQNAVFCLQPHGDSPTRKSFYDSIVSGCIPVIFKFYTENVLYPFQRVLKYSDFVVTIDASRVKNNGEFVLNILKDISKSETERLHNNVLRVARQLQYSFIDENAYELYHDTPYVDALDMIMDEVKYMYNL